MYTVYQEITSKRTESPPGCRGSDLFCKRKERQHMESIWQLDDGHGDYNRSYERDYDFDYADYSTDHKENNFRNYEWKIPKTKKERVKNILNHYE